MNPSEPTAPVDPTNEAPKPTAPVMDVVPPAAEKPMEASTTVPEEPAITEPKEPPVEDPADGDAENPEKLIQQEAAKPAPQPKPIKPPKQPGSSTSLAIASTVFVVVALSALAVFAYLQSK